MLPKLIIGLNALSKAEWKLFKKYVLMQTTEHTDTFAVFSLLQKNKTQLAQFETSTWQKKHHAHLPEKSFLNILSKLYLWLEEWIVYNNIKNDKVKSGIELVKHFNRNGLFKLADSKAKQVQALLDSENQYSPESDYNQYLLNYYQFYSDNPIKATNKNLIYELVQSYLKQSQYGDLLMTAQLDFWTIIRKVDTEKHNRLKKQLSPSITDPVHQNIYSLLADQKLESLDYCFNILKEGKIKRTDDLYTILTMTLLNLSLKLWNSQIITRPELPTEIWVFALEQGVLTNAGRLPFQRFVNIVNALGAFTTFEWTNKFIDTWGPKVDTPDISGVINFAKASNYFNHGYFDESMQYINTINTSLISSRAIIHHLTIRLYYETRDQNYDLLIDAMDRFHAYIRRRADDISIINTRRLKNFIRSVQYLLKGNPTEDGLKAFLPSANTLWLKAKVKEMGQLDS